ncbi:hypothetical protein ST37_06675 [Vibrio sp. qd031]|uniref:hypothetical protein n=1 Tax=Vibrio sp. qd031 TaxID=1603038 RepID=UPI000A0FCC90|nr:hypothetical protein [Vibrio sp. qd031]ORT51057.1 hypothetical protein ST37_06675 [Vibrio sp. qd031]
MIQSIIEKIRSIPHRIERARFKKIVQRVYDTPPVEVTPDADLIVVSQVHHKAVEMSLLSLKTFLSKFDECGLELIDDGSLTADDIEAYRNHFRGVKLIPISDVELMGCPQGGTWERLSYVVQRSQDKYVIQLDSDTLTLGDVDFVKQKIASNKPFLIGGPNYPEPIDALAMAKLATSWNSTHIQGTTESHLDKLVPTYIDHYVRGCSGFTGFPKQGITQQVMSSISEIMESAVGRDNWRRWGTEQVTSNILLSTFDDVEIAPWPAYQNYGFPFVGNEKDSPTLVHFIGTHRHANDYYRTLAYTCIHDLCESKSDQQFVSVSD